MLQHRETAVLPSNRRWYFGPSSSQGSPQGVGELGYVFFQCPRLRAIVGRFAAFSVLRGVRQVERFAGCSFDICRQSFSTWRASQEFSVALRISRSRRLLGGGAYTDCAEQWSPGILSRPPSLVGWRERGKCRPSGLGCGMSADAQCSPRAEKVVHMHRSTRHRERAPHELHARAHGTHVYHATARVASLVHTPRRHVID